MNTTSGNAIPGRPRLIVVGSGIAGLYGALLAADAGADVVLLTKGALADSNTYYAQGGISAVLDEPAPGDTVAAHIADTLQAGAGHCNPDAVRVLCTEARRDIAGLGRFGVRFDLDDDGDPALGLEAAHSAPRILHAGGDATGAGIANALICAVLAAQASGRIRLLGHARATALPQSGRRVTGVEFLHDGQLKTTQADAVLLATGGAGQLFAQTTNPSVATADGLALAWRAGAAVADLEFFQFHPTCMVRTAEAAEAEANQDPLLISEAVRGEGAVLVDAEGRRFMLDYHADAELAPRDVVSRSVALHLAALGDPTGHVYLDARVIEAAKGPGFLGKRFPTITRRTREAGIDWTRELVPVAPAAHYWMGGVSTDLHGRTTVPGLFAAGEVACTGVQGANRLASNSLLEGLVFGRRAVEAFLADSVAGASPDGAPPHAPHDLPNLASSAREPGSCGPTAAGGLPLTHASGTPSVDASETPDSGSVGASADGDFPAWEFEAAPARGPVEASFAPAGVFSRGALRRLMTANAGVLRTGGQLREAGAALAAWAAVVRPDDVPEAEDPREHEDANLLLAAQLLVHAAQERRMSLGAHYRDDGGPEAAAADDIDKRYRMTRKASLVHD
ncbi:L-aspartate oxidase [Arthrobacter sp. ISL-5]|uniref:L-aspartate oxidase n=1 Tax=Arthrobacter sp. ISL-5 TaxID=2819111 RepID=UPI001BEA85B8|nr:L-aspartate oxidase [Arthrobacter sp. ISL-5]MBT2553834.1 L-aspartate oxidase [Arthrobacter sp. ISL-5]